MTPGSSRSRPMLAVARILSGVVLLTVGCAKQYPANYAMSSYTRGQLTGETGASASSPFTMPPAMQSTCRDLVREAYPPPWTWTEEEVANSGEKAVLRTGQRLYQRHCVHCHGMSGAGDGPTAVSLNPLPRDFRRGVFKWKSTQGRSKPTHDDLVAILKDGALGTSMPPFRLLPDDQLDAMARYVAYLSQRGELEYSLMLVYSQEGPSQEELAADGQTLSDDDREEFTELLQEIAEEKIETLTEDWQDAADAVVTAEMDGLATPGTGAFEEAVARGREWFLGSDAGCTKCHGIDGRGRQDLSAADALDLWGNPNPPRNLTLGLWRGGRRPIDLYRRIHEGIAGSSMPGQGNNPKLNKDQMWDLVQFLRALPHRPQLLTGPADLAARSEHRVE